MNSRFIYWVICITMGAGCADKPIVELEQRVAVLEKKVAQLETELKAEKESDVVPISPVETKMDELLKKIDALQPSAPPPPVPLVEPDSEIPVPAGDADAKKEIAQIGLSKSTVAQIMDGAASQLRQCGFSTGSVITVKVHVAKTGRVSEVETLPPHQDTALGRCAAKVIYRLLFPATGFKTVFNHTYSF